MVGRAIRYVRRLVVAIGLLLSCYSLGGWCPTARAQIDTDRVLSIGQNAIYFKDYVLAIQYFNSAIEASPHRAEPYYYRGLAKYSLDDYLGAEQDSDAALQRNPFIVGAYYLRAIARHTMGKDTLALSDYATVLKNNPDHKGALHNYALLNISLNDSVKARETLDHLHQYYPDYAEGYMIDGGYHLQKGDTLQAEQLFEKAMQMAPGLSGAYISMASIKYDQGDFATAEAYTTKALEYNSGHADLYFNRALIRYRQNNIRGSMEDYSMAVHLDPANVMARYNRGLLRVQVGELNDALDDFSVVIQLQPDNYFAIFNRSLLAADLGFYEVAEGDLNIIVERYPTFIPAYTKRAEVRQNLGRTREAQQDLHYASKLIYDERTHQRAVARQDQLTAEEEETAPNAVRDDRDENIRKFEMLVYNSHQKGYNELYQEEEGIRGRVQDRAVAVIAEPLYTLSYYDVVDDKLRSNTNMRFSDQLGVSEQEGGTVIRVVRHMPQLSQLLIEQHLAWVQDYQAKAHPTTEERLHHVMDLLTLKDHNAVVAELDTLIQFAPNNAAAYFQRGTSRCLAHEASEAELRSNRPEQAPSRSPLFTTQMIKANNAAHQEYILRQGKAKESIADYQKVLDLVPNYAPALYNIAYLYAALGQHEEAIRYYDQAIEQQPDMGAAYFNRGLSHYAIGQKVKGDSDLSEAGARGFYNAYSIIRRMK